MRVLGGRLHEGLLDTEVTNDDNRDAARAYPRAGRTGTESAVSLSNRADDYPVTHGHSSTSGDRSTPVDMSNRAAVGSSGRATLRPRDGYGLATLLPLETNFQMRGSAQRRIRNTRST